MRKQNSVAMIQNLRHMHHISVKRTLTVLFVLIFSGAYAGNITFNNRLTGTAIAAGASMTMQDQEYFKIQAGLQNFADRNLTNIIKLSYRMTDKNAAAMATYSGLWTLSVNYTINFYDNANFLVSSLPNQVLTIEHSSTGTYKDIDAQKITGVQACYKYDVVINSVTPSVGMPSPLSNDIHFETEINTDRYYTLVKPLTAYAAPGLKAKNPTTAVFQDVTTSSINSAAGTKYYELEMNWPYITGAEEYELEWVYSFYDVATSGNPSSVPAPDFTKAARITTPDNFYRINLLYEQGFIYYRYRPVSKKLSDLTQILQGDWSAYGNILIETPHDAGANWTYGAVYAEDGKKKEVASYFDFSLRKRESVTRNNSNNTSMVMEDMYDFEGRPTIKVLPTVSQSSNDIKYYHNYSMSGSSVFDKKLFSSVQARLNTQKYANLDAGDAGLYYKAKTANGAENYLADAENVPYRQTVYNIEGKIQTQTAPGKTYALGNNHESKLFYASPSQYKLDKLFGNDAGYDKYYKLLVNKDANGQLSFTYINLMGKHVATSLVNDPLSENGRPLLEPLASNGQNTVLDIWDGTETYDAPNESWQNNKPFFVSGPGTYNFNVTIDNIAFSHCSGTHDCVYDLLMTFTDPCGTMLLEDVAGNPSMLNTLHTFNVSAGPQVYTFAITFTEAGTYMFNKTLSLNVANLLTEENNFKNSLMSHTSPCIIPTLGDIGTGLTNGTDASGCTDCNDFDAPCPDVVDCSSILSLLKKDLTPLGQYAENTPLTGPTVDDCWLKTWVWDDCINKGEVVDCYTSPKWVNAGYNDTYGVLLTNWPDYKINFDNSFLTRQLTTAIPDPGPATTNPYCAYTPSPINVVNNYDNIPFEALVEFHPEYCHYEWCEVISPSKNFDTGLMSMSASAAQSSGNLYLTGTSPYSINVSTLLAADPFFHSNVTALQFLAPWSAAPKQVTASSGDITAMTNMMNSGYYDGTNTIISMWQQAVYMTTGNAAATTLTPYELNKSWKVFVNYYLFEKLKITEAYKVNTFGCPYLYDANADGYADAPPSGVFSSAPNHIQEIYLKSEGFKIRALSPAFPVLPTGPGGSTSSLQQFSQVVCDYNASSNCEALASYEVNLSGISFTAGDHVKVQCQLPTGCGSVLVDVSDNTSLGVTIAGASTAWDDIANNINAYPAPSMTQGYTCPNVSPGNLKVVACVDHANNKITFYPTPGFGADFNGAVIKIYKNGTLQSTLPSTGFAGGFITTTGAACTDNTDDLNCFCAQIGDLRDEYIADVSLHGTYSNYTDYIVATLNTDYSLTGTSVVTPGDVNTWLSNCYTSKTNPNPLYEDAENWPGQMPESVANYDANTNQVSLTSTVPPELRCYVFSDPCVQDVTTINTYYSDLFFGQIVNSTVAAFVSAYKAHCLGQVNPSYLSLHTNATYVDNEYHFTLYYYDQAGNLTRTVPPKGVVPLNNTQIASAQAFRANGSGVPVLADHGGKHLVSLSLSGNNLARNYNTTVAGTNTSADPNIDLCASQHYNPLVTSYVYNSYNQLLSQTTPDAGTTTFWYDKKSKLSLSQNEEQFSKTDQEYTYTIYDNLIRVREIGKLELNHSNSDFPSSFSRSIGNTFYFFNSAFGYQDYLLHYTPGKYVKDVVNNPVTNISEITKTFYDQDVAATADGVLGYFTSGNQLNKRNRITATQRYAGRAASTMEHGTYFSYDEHGNVSELVQKNALMYSQYGNLAVKKIMYDYDQVSGKANKVIYQPGETDQYIHRYSYDAENKITAVYTSKDGILWDRDADYFYYQHGPLARTETGDKKVQGIDYAYTIQGWIKGVNAALIRADRDQGRDAFIRTTTNFSYDNTYQAIHRNVGNDAFSYSLHYFDGDYKAVSETKYAVSSDRSGYYFLSQMPGAGTNYRNVTQNLYNGNISAMVSSIFTGALGAATLKPQLAAYSYDQLNRLVKQNVFADPQNGLTNGNKWVGNNTNNGEYQMELSYDPMGNIKHLKRNGITTAGHVEMDDLTYDYDQINSTLCTNTGNGMSTEYNTLNNVSNISLYNQNQSFVSQSAGNYQYDLVGNLTKDNTEGISNISWDVCGKIKGISYISGFNRSGIYPANLQYIYDAAGNRVVKIKIPRSVSGAETNPDKWIYEYYTRDAQGNILAVYEGAYGMAGARHLNLSQRDVYGSSRLGTDLRLVPQDNNVLQINNNSFVSGTENWSTNGIATHDAVTERLKVQTAVQYQAPDLYFTTVKGKTYEISYQLDKSMDAAEEIYAEVYDAPSTTWVAMPVECLQGVNYISFTAKSSQSRFRIMKASASGPTTVYYIDNVLIKQAEDNRYSGYKNYELSNHLGNVLSVVSDSKLALDNGTYNSQGVQQNTNPDGKIDLFGPEVVSSSHYYAFGEAMPGLQFNNGSYRYGFNGKENDNGVHLDASGLPLVGSQQDYGMRIYNAALGRFLSVDPLSSKFAFYSPYHFSGNRPIWANDLDGCEDNVNVTTILADGAKYTAHFFKTGDDNIYFENTVQSIAQYFKIDRAILPSTGVVNIEETKNSLGERTGVRVNYMPTVVNVVDYQYNFIFRCTKAASKFLSSISGTKLFKQGGVGAYAKVSFTAWSLTLRADGVGVSESTGGGNYSLDFSWEGAGKVNFVTEDGKVTKDFIPTILDKANKASWGDMVGVEVGAYVFQSTAPLDDQGWHIMELKKGTVDISGTAATPQAGLKIEVNSGESGTTGRVGMSFDVRNPLKSSTKLGYSHKLRIIGYTTKQYNLEGKSNPVP